MKIGSLSDLRSALLTSAALPIRDLEFEIPKPGEDASRDEHVEAELLLVFQRLNDRPTTTDSRMYPAEVLLMISTRLHATESPRAQVGWYWFCTYLFEIQGGYKQAPVSELGSEGLKERQRNALKSTLAFKAAGDEEMTLLVWSVAAVNESMIVSPQNPPPQDGAALTQVLGEVLSNFELLTTKYAEATADGKTISKALETRCQAGLQIIDGLLQTIRGLIRTMIPQR